MMRGIYHGAGRVGQGNSQARDLIDIANGKRDPDRPWRHANGEEVTRTRLTDIRDKAWQAAERGEELLDQSGHEAELRAIADRARGEGE